MIEYEPCRKSYSALNNPVFNLLDPSSAITWLELRSLMKDVGREYKTRLVIQAFVSSAAILVIWALVFANMYELVSITLRPDEWLFLIIALLDQTIPLVKLMFAMASINDETENQIKQFNEIRYFIYRLISDKDIMIDDSCNQIVIQNKALNKIV